jgi:hypothetical protein
MVALVSALILSSLSASHFHGTCPLAHPQFSRNDELTTTYLYYMLTQAYYYMTQLPDTLIYQQHCRSALPASLRMFERK